MKKGSYLGWEKDCMSRRAISQIKSNQIKPNRIKSDILPEFLCLW